MIKRIENSSRIIMQAKGRPDLFQTPKSALLPLFDYLNPNWIVWECATGKGYLEEGFRERGFSVVGTDILTGTDFLTWCPEKFDCIVTNPPYAIRYDFIERCYKLNKPFALLMPLTSLEGIRRQNLFREFGVEIIFMPRRVNFETPTGTGKSAWFATAWFTHGLNLGKELLFWKGNEHVKNLFSTSN